MDIVNVNKNELTGKYELEYVGKQVVTPQATLGKLVEKFAKYLKGQGK